MGYFFIEFLLGNKSFTKIKHLYIPLVVFYHLYNILFSVKQHKVCNYATIRALNSIGKVNFFNKCDCLLKKFTTT